MLFGHISIAQDLSCSDFKSGIFVLSSENVSPFNYKVIRNDSSQIEIELDSESEKISYQIIEWIDDCNYIMKFDDSKMELDYTHKLINELGGMLIKKEKIERNCFFYQSSIKGNGIDIKVNGKICKE